jgi:hypothetical protein
MRRSLTLRDHAFLALLFGGMLAYLAFGAVTGDQFIPYKRSAGGLHLSGFAAWVVTLGPALIYVGILVRYGFLASLGPRVRLAAEFGFLLAGIGAFVGGMRLGVLPCNC